MHMDAYGRICMHACMHACCACCACCAIQINIRRPQGLPIQRPQSLPILTHLEASKHPSIQASLTAGIPHSIILKGSQLAPAGDFSTSNLEPPRSTLGPQIGAPACTGMPNGSFDRHLSIQASQHPQIGAAACTGMPQSWASEHPGIHSSGPRGRRQRR